MPGIVFYIIAMAVLRALRLALVERRGAKPRGLCSECAFVHMQYGANGRNAVFCTYGGGVRPVTLDVLYCTDFRNRYVQIRPARIGFVPGFQGVEAEALRDSAKQPLEDGWEKAVLHPGRVATKSEGLLAVVVVVDGAGAFECHLIVRQFAALRRLRILRWRLRLRRGRLRDSPYVALPHLARMRAAD